MTKAKKAWIITLSSVFAVIIVLIVLFFALFCLRSVSVEFETTTNVFSSIESKNAVLSSCEYKTGKSLFLQRTEDYKNVIEKKNPYVKIVNFEFKFPSKMVIHCAEREEFFAIPHNEKYLICDEELKVLRVVDSFTSDKTNAILLSVSPLGTSLESGDFVTLAGNQNDILKSFKSACVLNNRTAVESKAYFKEMSFVEKTDAVSALKFQALVLKNHSDFEYNIYIAEQNLDKKMQKLFACESLIEDAERTTHFLVIYENSEKKIFGLLTEK